MPAITRAGEPSVRSYARLLLRLHELDSRGEGESPQADAVRDEMDQPWTDLTEAERELVRGLSADLHSLAEGGRQGVPMGPDERRRWAEEFRSAWEGGDHRVLLSLLRRPYPHGLPANVIPFLQARCWEALGSLDAALRFMREAEGLEPSNAVLVLVLLDRLGYVKEAEQYARRIIQDPHAGPSEVYLATANLLLPTRHLSNQEAKSTIEEVVPPLRGALKAARALPKEDTSEGPNPEPWIAYALGLCYERLGKDSEAIDVYSRTLERYPADTDLLVARGVDLFERDRQAALADLEKARKLGTVSVWPFYLLARQALDQGNYAQAWRLSLEGLDCRGPNSVRAQLQEWVAIAQSELGQPLHLVMESFALAEELDPNEERIRVNREVARARAEAPRSGDRWQQKPASGRVAQGVRRSEFDRFQESFSDQRSNAAVNQLLAAS